MADADGEPLTTGESALELALLTTVDIDFTLTAAGRDVAYLSQDQSTNLPCVLTLTNKSAGDLTLHPSQADGSATTLVVSFGDLATWPHTELTADVQQGALELPVRDITGWAAGGDTLAVLRDGDRSEAVTVTSARTSPDGHHVVTLAAAAHYAHRQGARIAGGVAALKIQSDDWTPVFSDTDDAPAWTFTLANDLPIAPGGSVAVMSVGNLLVEGRPRITGVTVDYALGRLASGSLTAWLRVTDPPPPAHRDHLDNLLVTFTPYLNTVWVTPEGEADAPYALEFTLSNGSLNYPLADPNDGTTLPTFYLFFNYGTGGNTLTTAARAAKARLKWIDGEDWAFENADAQIAVPYWMLKPKPEVLKARSSVTFRLEGLVSHCPPEMRSNPGGAVSMFLVYTGVRGVKDGVIPVTVGKAPAVPKILRFAAWPTQVNVGDPVGLSWQTVAVSKLLLTFTDHDGNERSQATELPLNADDYSTPCSMVGQNLFHLTGFDRGAKRLTDPSPAIAIAVTPTLDGLEAAPVHVGDAPVVTWRARHANAVIGQVLAAGERPPTAPPAAGGSPIALPRTTLIAPAMENDVRFTVASASGFPTSDPFDVQIDQEFVTVVSGAGTPVWTIDRRTEHKPYPAGTAVTAVTLTRPLSSAAAQVGQSCAMWALSNGFATAPRDTEIPIRPRITAFDAPSFVDVGEQFTLRWTLDDFGRLDADLVIDGVAGNLSGTSETTARITRATTFTLTATSRRYRQSESRSVRVGARRVTALLPGERPIAMLMSPDKTRLYVQCPTTYSIAVLDNETRAIRKRIPIPRHGDSRGFAGFGVALELNAITRVGVLTSGEPVEGRGDRGGVQGASFVLDMETDELVSPRPETRFWWYWKRGLIVMSNGVELDAWQLDSGPRFLKQWGVTSYYQIEPGGNDGALHVVDYEF